MSSNLEEDPIAQFKKLTGVNESIARHYIKTANGSIEQAVATYFEDSAKQTKTNSRTGNIRTFQDEDEENKQKGKDDQEFFVGR